MAHRPAGAGACDRGGGRDGRQRARRLGFDRTDLRDPDPGRRDRRLPAADHILAGPAVFRDPRRSHRLVRGVLLTVTFTTHGPALGLGLSIVLVVLEMGALALTLAFAFEITDAIGRDKPVVHTPPRADTYRPRVCLQVPAYNEPPDLLRQTLDALSALDYPELTIQVIVNNTTDPQLWMPVEEDCRRLGPRFRFIHLPSWPGFKAGALNEATRRLEP